MHDGGIVMKGFAFAMLAAGSLVAASLGLAAPAVTAPSGPGTVQDTVNSLQASGYQVIVSKVGNAPLEQCTVTAVRPGQTYSRTDSGVPGAGNDVVTTVTNKTVYVDVRC
jgi:hypothetical protein